MEFVIFLKQYKCLICKVLEGNVYFPFQENDEIYSVVAFNCY